VIPPRSRLARPPTCPPPNHTSTTKPPPPQPADQVRQALSDVKSDPENGLSKWTGDADVMRALDLLEAAFGGGGGAGGGAVVDVTPDKL